MAERKPRDATYEVIVPADVDVSWCPQGCGGFTEDPYGGPCKVCWREVERQDPEGGY
jgi:hypothetical protein